MISHSRSSHNNSADSEWRTLTAFNATRATAATHAGIDAIAHAVRGLNLMDSQLQQIETAIIGAVQNATIRRRRLPQNHAVQIRLLVTGNVTHAVAAQCWGFFLLERIVDDAHHLADGSGYVIDVFLYPEGNTSAAARRA